MVRTKDKTRGLKLAVIICACIFVLSCAATAWAALQTTLELNQNIASGTVDVEAQTASGSGPTSGDYLIVDKTNFYAANQGSLPFYLRAKVSAALYDTNGEKVTDADTSFIHPNIVAASNGSGAWVNGSDGYYYWNNMVSPSETTANLVEGAGVDADIPASYGDYTVRVTVDYEAIQATHSAAESIWDKANIYEAADEITSTEDLGNQVYAVIQDDGISLSSGSTTIDEAYLVPGGTVSYTLSVENETDKTRQVYLSASIPDNVSSEQRDLLATYLTIEVKDGSGNIVWNGSFKDLSQGFKTVGSLASGEVGTLYITASLRGDAPNSLQNMRSSMEWIISASGYDNDNANGSGGSSSSGGFVSQTSSSPDTGQHAQTGDYMNCLVPGIIALLSGLVLIFLVRKQKRTAEN